MTAQDVINRVDVLIPNAVPPEEKCRWVAEAEQMLLDAFCPGSAAAGEALTVPFPWDALYVHYLEMKLYYFQGETARQNQARAMYQAVYEGYRDYRNRTGLPRERNITYF